jgi:valyl-tRNA synthetase
MAKFSISNPAEMKISISVGSEDILNVCRPNVSFIKTQTGIRNISVGIDLIKPPHSVTAVVLFPGPMSHSNENVEIHMEFQGIEDVIEKERALHEKEIEKTKKALEGTEKKLMNKQFLEKAPAQVVEQAKAKQAELTEKINKLKESLESLK